MVDYLGHGAIALEKHYFFTPMNTGESGLGPPTLRLAAVMTGLAHNAVRAEETVPFSAIDVASVSPSVPEIRGSAGFYAGAF